MTSSAHSRPEPQPLPAIAAVMATALLLSVAMAGGSVPGIGSVGAVQAVLRSAGSGSISSMSATAPSTEFGIDSDPLRPITLRSLGTSEHDRYLAAAASGPGRGDLPPPTA